MFGLQNNFKTRERALEYATRNDFETIFTDDMSALHTLAFVLTADEAKADQCFVAGLEESIQGNPVFREWARSWSKRVIIRHAIKMMAPAPGEAQPLAASLPTRQAASDRDAFLYPVLQLPPFERFVFVISVLEGHSASDCASLLGCTLTELTRARSQALTHVARFRSAPAAVPKTHNTTPLRFAAKLEWA
jgi:DNA-directed RNA polymerase specialized sigma24 family protein